MTIISLYNNKGGVGKTTSTINISYCLAKSGYKTLIIDSDSQSNATNTLLNKETKYSFYDVLKESIGIKEASIEISNNLYLLPNTIKSSILDIELISQLSRENILKEKIKSLNNYFDYVFIDCSPSMSITNINNLVASDYYLIPCQLEYYCLEGIPNVYQFIDMIKRLNPNIRLLGCLATFQDKRKIANKEILNNLKSFFKNDLFNTVISNSVKVSEAPSHKKTIFEYDNKNKVSTEYVKVTNEIMQRIKK